MAPRPRGLQPAEIAAIWESLPDDPYMSNDDLESSADEDDSTVDKVSIVPEMVSFDILNNGNESEDELSCEESEAEEESISDDDETEWKKIPLAHQANLPEFPDMEVRPTFVFSNIDRPIAYFRRFFDDDLMDILVDNTNLYANQTHAKYWVPTNKAEMLAFLGIFVGMGLHDVPTIDLFWSTDNLFRVSPIADIMPVKRFKKILQCFHLNDNEKAPRYNEPNFDKLYKLRPVINRINDKCQSEAMNTNSHSIDESMILFKGRSSLKQYMPLKPIKRGYKVWARTDSQCGYLYQFQVYTGRLNNVQTEEGLGARVVKDLTRTLIHSNSHVAFDNFFTSPELLEDLFSDGIYATATVRATRKGNSKMTKRKNKIAKGAFKWRVKSHVGCIQWMDTKLVNVLSTAFKPNQISATKRTQKDGSSVQVSCPQSVIEYTKRMGGVDRFDKKKGCYGVGRKSKKWWLRIFYFLLDVAIVNAYILYNATRRNANMTQIKFRTALFRGMAENFSTRKTASTSFKKKKVEHNKEFGIPEEIRLGGVGIHFPRAIETFRRCRFCSSKTNNKRSKIECSQCLVPLCAVPCFANFHTYTYIYISYICNNKYTIRQRQLCCHPFIWDSIKTEESIRK